MSETERDLLVDPPTRSEQTVRIYAVVLSVGVVCSLAIVTVYEFTRPIIERNKIALRRDAIGDVLSDAATIAAFHLDPISGQFQATSTDAAVLDLVFAGFDRHGELVGLAIETQGMGYQDSIRLLYGYSPDEQAIIGIRILESRETPGLGDRIETDADFLSNFHRLDVRLNADGRQLAHTIEFVKPGKKTAGWQIDGITGATISSRAIAEMLRDSTASWIPRVYPRRTDFARPESEE
jgi:electron transport complex protein RnfG